MRSKVSGYFYAKIVFYCVFLLWFSQKRVIEILYSSTGLPAVVQIVNTESNE